MTVAQRRQQEREHRRILILSAAEQVFLAKGFEATTMEDVATAARLGKGTLYLYFTSKDDLLLGMATRRHDQMVARFEQVNQSAPDGISELRGLLLAYATSMAEPREHLQMMMSCWVTGRSVRQDLPGAAVFRERVTRAFGLIAAALVRGQQDGTIRRGAEPRRTALQLWSSVNGALLLQLQLALGPADHPLRELRPTLEQSVDGCLDAVRVHTAQPQPAEREDTAAGDAANGTAAGDAAHGTEARDEVAR